MRIRFFLLFAALCVVGPASAQVQKSTLNSQVSSSLPDNSSGAITPAIVRTLFNSIIASFQQFAGVNAVVNPTYTFAPSDYGQLVSFNSAVPVAVTLPQATGNFSTWNAFVNNIGAGTVTITPTTSTINGATTYSVTQGSGVWIVSDGTNYQVFAGTGSVSSVSNSDGTLVITPTSGSVVASLALSHANAWSGLQTFNNAKLAMLGSSSGATTISSANSGASNFTLTLPALTGTFAIVSNANVASVSNVDGSLTISPTTGVVVASLAPSHANTWSALQTFNNSDIAMLGSSTGATTISSANASASNFTATIPANTGTVAETNLAQSWTAAQTFNNFNLKILGNSTGVTTISNANSSASNFTQTLQALNATISNTIASGAAALSTTPISSAACSSAQAVSATNTLTTDAIVASFNGDPTGVTGYVPSTNGMLTIIPYPTVDTVNFKVCNNTASTITPGNVTINWRVVR